MGPTSGLMIGVLVAGLKDFKILEWQGGERRGGSNNLQGKLCMGKTMTLFLFFKRKIGEE